MPFAREIELLKLLVSQLSPREREFLMVLYPHLK
jgi:hypothetical protein